MKLVFESLNEFYRGSKYSDDYENVKDVLDIGNRKARDFSKLQKFAKMNGYDFKKDPKRGTIRITVPMEFEEKHEIWGNKQEGNKGEFFVDAIQYTITYPEGGWDEVGIPIPAISLRKRWMRHGKGVKQQLIDRFGRIEDAIKRIEQNILRERKKRKQRD